MSDNQQSPLRSAQDQAAKPNGESVAHVAFQYDPKRGVHVDRQGGIPRHALIHALEKEKVAALARPLASEALREPAEVRFSWFPNRPVEVTRKGSLPEDMLVMAINLEVTVLVNQTLAMCMNQDVAKQIGRVLLPDGSTPPPGMLAVERRGGHQIVLDSGTAHASTSTEPWGL